MKNGRKESRRSGRVPRAPGGVAHDSPGADSRPGETPLIIHRPDLQARPKRWFYWIATLAAWAIWVYLWLPLITLGGWYLGMRSFVHEIVLPDPSTLVVTGGIYLGIIIALGSALVVWSRYNLKRFGGDDRRRTPERVREQELRDWFNVSPRDMGVLRSGRSLMVHHDDEGGVRGVTLRKVRPQTPESPEREPVAV